MGRIYIEYWMRYEKDNYGGKILKGDILSGIDKGCQIFKSFDLVKKECVYHNIENYYRYNKANNYHPYRDKEE